MLTCIHVSTLMEITMWCFPFYSVNVIICSSFWRRQWQPTPVFVPAESHIQGSLVGCSLWGRTESDSTERLHFHFSLSCIGEGNGNPLQCACLENPRDGGAWWAAVYGVTQSRTRLKWLSSSSILHSENKPDSVWSILFLILLIFYWLLFYFRKRHYAAFFVPRWTKVPVNRLCH